MGVVKSKYWRKKKCKTKNTSAPRSKPIEAGENSTDGKNIIDQILEHEDYEVKDVESKNESIKISKLQNQQPDVNINTDKDNLDQIEDKIEELEELVEYHEEIEVLEELEKVSVVTKDDFDPYSIVTNVLRIFTSLQHLIINVYMSEYTIGSTVYINSIVNSGKVFYKSIENLKDNRKLEMWVWPLQPWQTSLVTSKAKSLCQDYDQISNSLEEYVASHASNVSLKKILMDDIKFFLNDLQMMYYCLELSTPEILNSQIESLSYYMKAVIEAATISQDIEAYDIIARICTTESIKLGRICSMKGILQFNVELQMNINELAYSIVRAIKVLTVIGRTIVEDNSNITAKKNLVTLAGGTVKYFSKISELALNCEHKSDFTFTPEVVDRCINLYSSAIKELLEALLQYKSSASCDSFVVYHIQQLASEVKILQSTFLSYSKTTLITISRITRNIEIICAHVYSRITDETDEIVKDMLMNGMYAILHFCMQLNLAASSKAIRHHILPQEITILSCVRSIFITLSILLTSACPLVLENTHMDIKTPYIVNYEEELSEEAEKALIDIIHYGRPLILTQNPLIVVEYDEKKDVDNTFKTLEDELFKEYINDTNIDYESVRKRPNSIMVPGYKPNPFAMINLSLRNGKIDGNEKSYFDKIENNLQRRPTILKRNATYRIKNDAHEKSESNLSSNKLEKNELNSKSTISERKTVQRPTHVRNLSLNNGSLRTKSFLRTRLQETKKSQSINEAELHKSKQLNSIDLVEPWTDIPSDEINENNLPEGYPPPPPIPTFQKGGSEAEYKEYMIKRYERETWENKLIVYKRKLKEQQEILAKQSK